MREVKKYNYLNGSFEKIDFENLRNGDIFQLFDNKTQVIDEEGTFIFQAISNPYINKDKIYTIDYKTNISYDF